MSPLQQGLVEGAAWAFALAGFAAAAWLGVHGDPWAMLTPLFVSLALLAALAADQLNDKGDDHGS